MTKAPTTEDILIGDSWKQLFDCESWRVEYLVHFGASDDVQRRDRARILLSGLRRRESRHEICRIAMSEHHPWLDQLLSATDFAPEQKADFPIFLVTTGQWDRYLSEVANVAALIPKLSQSNPVTEKAAKMLTELSEPSGVKLLLKLYADGSLLSARIEDIIRSALLSQKSAECVQIISQFWAESRNERFVAVLKKLPRIETGDRNLQILTALKIDRIFDDVKTTDLSFLIQCLEDLDHEISEGAKQSVFVLDRDKSSTFKNEFFGLLFNDSADTLVQVAAQLSSRPEDKIDHALYCVLTRNWDELADLDPDGSILDECANSKRRVLSQAMKLRLSDCLRSAARSEWVTNVFGLKNKLKLSEMTDLDWQLLQNSLSSTSSWNDLWRLIHFMPALSARRFLRRLLQVGWRPEDASENTRFEKLLYFAKRLSSDQIPIWSGLDYLGAVDLGSPLFGSPGDGGVESLENRFGFSNDGGTFFFADRSGAIRMWHLPSLLSSQFVVGDMPNVCSIALAPNEPLIAFSNQSNRIQVCDLTEKRIVSSFTLDETTSYPIISNLKFSDSGNYLTGCLRPVDRKAVISGIMWNMQKANSDPHTIIPQRANVSSNDEWLLYRTHGMIHLSTIDRKMTPLSYQDSFFRVRDANFLPDSSGVVLFEKTNVHLHDINDFNRIQSMNLPHELSVYISDQERSRLLVLHNDYSFEFVSIDKSKMQSQCKTQSFRQLLADCNVWLAPVADRKARVESHASVQIHKDPRGTHLAVVHAAGSISFWSSPFSILSRKSPLLFSENDREQIRRALLSTNLSEGELAWLRFISELSGSLDHYSVELSDVNAISINDFDIELE
ncbi:MAG: WD40 repeat domain-containing protein [Candidatus Obscuribacterales bacterium]|jgi:hypothetical protein|nr:WD40 repeat domain-containing protein [Candidatus Obscuribacterales bacterium]